jgi:hypothetical protein
VYQPFPESDVYQPFPEGGACLPDKGTDGDIDSDPEYSDAAWTKEPKELDITESKKGLTCARFKG